MDRLIHYLTQTIPPSLLHAKLIHSTQASPLVPAFTIVTLLSTSGLTRRDVDVPPCKPGMDGLPPRRRGKGWVRESTHAASFPRLLFLFLLSLITLPQRARAACSLADLGTSCRVFFSDSPSFAINRYTDAYHEGAAYFQLGLRSTPTAGYTFYDFQYSRDNETYIPFPNPSFPFPPPTLTSGNITRYMLVQTIDPIDVLPFFISYTIPTGIPTNTALTIFLLTNTDGYTEGGVLAENPDPDAGSQLVSAPRFNRAVAPTQAPTVRPTRVRFHVIFSSLSILLCSFFPFSIFSYSCSHLSPFSIS